ncbi:MAG: isoamylase early set domain-containing protein [Vibrio gallaecicus]|uniref:Isoamylase early set domain-containing protein n=1 Tax=Vibrio gallaecicus TaxID=552386 RepID=A0ABV4NFK6_9VIBR|nr:isoamylase early set domain-containing protein [Vibrio gallaecicus]MDN3616503.1 isoamylase early set domain-containing protein [Vibrio gallaecicus]
MINKRFFKTKDEVEVTFELEAQEATSVSIVADFLDWKETPMKKLAKGKVYKFKARLPRDEQFQFRYLVNGQQWVNDANADSYIQNGFGEDNCLVTTGQ